MKIRFTPGDEFSDSIIDHPRPAAQFLPDWYKKMPSHTTEDSRHGLALDNVYATNTTVKHCSPFLDGLTAGYIWALPVDIEVRRNELGHYSFRWRTEGTFMSPHGDVQAPGLPAVAEGERFVMKWQFPFIIETPPGYSALFTHPFNRHDLPFRTFTGIVETDRYTDAVQFPFQLITKDTDEISIIPAGTPLVQIVPFKRDDWQSERGTFDPKARRRDNFDYFSKIVKAYKSRFWIKKKWQ